MVKVYGRSDAETEFFSYVNSNLVHIKLNSIEECHEFQNNPYSRKNEEEKKFDDKIEKEKKIKNSLSERNKEIYYELKNLNQQISYKSKAAYKYRGPLKEKIRGEVEELRNKKIRLEKELPDNKSLQTQLTTKIRNIEEEKRRVLGYIAGDINTFLHLKDQSKYKNLKKGAIGELQVIEYIKDNFKDKNYFLINAFNLDLLGKAINVNNYTLYKTKIDHLLLSPYGLFVLETKTWKSCDEAGKKTVVDQLERIRETFSKLFKDKIKMDFIKLVLVCTDSHIDINGNEHFRSVRLDKLKDEIERGELILPKDEIHLIFATLSDYMEGNISKMGKMNAKIKSHFVKTKKFLKKKLKK